jgi:uncharacterized protein YxjI
MRYLMRQKMFSFADGFQIKDEDGRDAFVVNGAVFSFGKQLSFEDLEGNELVSIRQKLLSLKTTYEISKGDDLVAVVTKDLFNLFSYRFEIDLSGSDSMEATGNFMDREYVISRGGEQIAAISKKWFSLTDTYGVDIEANEDDVLILAITVVIDMVCHPDHK